jgi:murein L,D-transpeptidase YcbB/YkuD
VAPLSLRLSTWLTIAALAASGGPPSAAETAGPTPPPAVAAVGPTLDAEDAAVLVGALSEAAAQDLASPTLKPADAAAMLNAPDPAIRQAARERLTAAVIAYAAAQHGGRIAGRFHADWAIRPASYDAKADFAAALAAHELSAWVRSLPPPDPRYARLVQAYARYQEIAAAGGWPVLAPKPSLKLGDTGERVEALRRRLAVEDPATPAVAAMTAPAPASPPASAAKAPPPPAPTPAPTAAPAIAPPAPPVPLYDAALAAAVSRAQARYGLTPDGVAGASTVAALNVPVTRRLDQIRANLERWRWAPRTLPAYRVELNIADPSLVLFDPAAPTLSMRAIVGKADKRTPTFQDHIDAVVLNPPWNVPPDIAAKEVWPKIRRDPGYMAREGFVVRPGGGLQQRPGPKCALGTIKFDLSNPFGVYLHDTPSRSLFARDSRDLSHGCMRLEKPNALAKRLLRDEAAWPEDRIDMVLASGVTVRAPLQRPVPVFVFYWSAFVDDQGQVEFRSDVYHWDEDLLELL